ncbi:hypothetical protein PATSB16_27090 [Pandoraea thiooxydans]|nr:hypothetical protein PATSB16_27090 [Pandoraea thiooxydans]
MPDPRSRAAGASGLQKRQSRVPRARAAGAGFFWPPRGRRYVFDRITNGRESGKSRFATPAIAYHDESARR